MQMLQMMQMLLQLRRAQRCALAFIAAHSRKIKNHERMRQRLPHSGVMQVVTASDVGLSKTPADVMPRTNCGASNLRPPHPPAKQPTLPTLLLASKPPHPPA